MEMAQRDVENIKQIGTPNPQPEVNVNKVFTKPKAKPQQYQQQNKSQARETTLKCWRCGGQHLPRTCHFRYEECNKCHRKGHTKSQCESVKAYQQKQKIRAYHLNEQSIEQAPENPQVTEEISHLEEDKHSQVNHLGRNKPFYISPNVNGKTVLFEVDTGSPWSIVSQETFKGIGSLTEVSKSDVSLSTYTGTSVPIVGETKVRVLHLGKSKQLPLLIVKEGVSLLGRDWIRELGISLSVPKLNIKESVDPTIQVHHT
ncbi:hypothetical protein BSL78_09736 [Apostichopus japonicus]|uniref:Peptidase A2 domain-containing protein n=1 Tax=Stichopus japonicus TaxID=307972 RepID=A0A2G8KZC9_STIJA|nr:hypothetical protein BSL78_09736 [Apostichopus japonicus]